MIKNIEMDSRDSVAFRKQLRLCGFLSASYLSSSGFDAASLKKLALAGRLDAVRWYYRERQAERARLLGLA